MTGFAGYQCPKCELRFTLRTEMEYHLREDHPEPARPEAVPGDHQPEPTSDPSDEVPLARSRAATTPHVDPSRRGFAALLVGMASLALALLVYLVLFVSIAAGVAGGVLMLTLAVGSLRRVRGRARIAHHVDTADEQQATPTGAGAAEPDALRRAGAAR